jgi:hypothetical protein
MSKRRVDLSTTDRTRQRRRIERYIKDRAVTAKATGSDPDVTEADVCRCFKPRDVALEHFRNIMADQPRVGPCSD